MLTGDPTDGGPSDACGVVGGVGDDGSTERGNPTSECCGAADVDWFGAGLYRDADREVLPEASVLASLGCGNPTAVADLHPGETVLDLGSGGGIDVVLSAKRVGPIGKVYGLDMTDEMLELARATQPRRAPPRSSS